MSLCSALACARPSLPEDGVEFVPTADAGADASESVVTEQRDSEVVAPVKDAGPIVPPDAGCADRDDDGVCDELDNCPDDANPDQQDSDADGVGDVCAAEAVNCDGEVVRTGIALGSAVQVNKVTINGTAGTFARVAPGSTVTVSLRVTISDCGLAIGAQQVYLGLGADDAKCESRPCTEYASFSLDLPFEIVAPLETGLHYVLAGTSAALACGGPTPTGDTVNPEIKTKVAALCVSK